MKPRGFNYVVPDTAKPTTLDLCRAECASAWLVQRVQSDRLSWVWIWMRPCGKSGFLYKVLSLSMLLCRTQQRAWDGIWSVLALEKEALHLRSVGMETGNTGERSLCFLGENTLSMEGALKMSSAEQQNFEHDERCVQLRGGCNRRLAGELAGKGRSDPRLDERHVQLRGGCRRRLAGKGRYDPQRVCGPATNRPRTCFRNTLLEVERNLAKGPRS